MGLETIFENKRIKLLSPIAKDFEIIAENDPRKRFEVAERKIEGEGVDVVCVRLERSFVL